MADNKALKFDRNATERGFAHLSFVDLYGARCSLQKSSLATLEAIWLGCDKIHIIPGGIPINGRMHLSRRQARQLAKRLLKFADTGEI